MAKQVNPLKIMNSLGAAAHKKAQPKEGSPAEEMSESPVEAASEGDHPRSPKQNAAIAASEAKKKGPKFPMAKK